MEGKTNTRLIRILYLLGFLVSYMCYTVLHTSNTTVNVLLDSVYNRVYNLYLLFWRLSIIIIADPNNKRPGETINLVCDVNEVFQNIFPRRRDRVTYILLWNDRPNHRYYQEWCEKFDWLHYDVK